MGHQVRWRQWSMWTCSVRERMHRGVASCPRCVSTLVLVVFDESLEVHGREIIKRTGLYQLTGGPHTNDQEQEPPSAALSAFCLHRQLQHRTIFLELDRSFFTHLKSHGDFLSLDPVLDSRQPSISRHASSSLEFWCSAKENSKQLS